MPSERSPPKKPEWKINEALAVGKGATVQEFVATIGEDRLEIDVAPWGEGHLKVNGVERREVNDEERTPLCLGLLLAIVASPAVRAQTAQTTINVAKITCEQLTLMKVADPDHIAIWLSTADR